MTYVLYRDNHISKINEFVKIFVLRPFSVAALQIFGRYIRPQVNREGVKMLKGFCAAVMTNGRLDLELGG
jgi:hypothetical protein